MWSAHLTLAFQLLRGHGWMARLIPTCGLRRRLGALLQCDTIFRKLTASQGILLFYSYLPNKKLVIYPNKESLVCSSCFDKNDIGREVVKAAKNLVLQLHQATSKDNLIEEIQKKQQVLEEKMDKVMEQLQSLTKLLGKKC